MIGETCNLCGRRKYEVMARIKLGKKRGVKEDYRYNIRIYTLRICNMCARKIRDKSHPSGHYGTDKNKVIK